MSSKNSIAIKKTPKMIENYCSTFSTTALSYTEFPRTNFVSMVSERV